MKIEYDSLIIVVIKNNKPRLQVSEKPKMFYHAFFPQA